MDFQDIDYEAYIQKARNTIASALFIPAMMIAGTSALKIDDTGRIKLRPATEKTEPQRGLKSDGKFRKAGGQGSLFKFYGSTVGIIVEDIEALVNPATLEILEGKERVETDGGDAYDEEKRVGAPEKGKDEDDYEEDLVEEVPVRSDFMVNFGHLENYTPFSMLDGNGFRKTTDYVRTSVAKYGQTSPMTQTAFSIVLLLIGYWMGSNQGGGGGGGAGGGSIPMPYISVPTDYLVTGFDLAAMGGLF
ncbi:hypothetical protein [Halorussus pelagicus]|uniref:hypothetical protein n=1 Tax=Halorussus pelagicus TaxID=2505977 RepID=UPI000FFB4AC3|nr:hypothetical protein [Halorussus pelagicus]